MTLEKLKQRRRSMQEELIQIAKDYARTLEKAFGRVTVVLYGSVVRGDFNQASDIDVLVISDNLPKRFLDRLDVLLEKAKAGIEPKGYTKEEFEKLRNKKNFQFMLLDKIVLLDDLGLFS